MKKTKTLLLYKVPIWCFILCLLLCKTVAAQTEKISGLVSDAKTGTPLAGASVTVKGTTKTVATTDGGNYSIDAAPGDVLVITYAGRISKEIKVGSAKQINVPLTEDVGRMEEVVVIGYGTQKKKLTTGANLQVKGDDIAKQSTTSALQGLQGQAPGVQITTSSGQPGSGMNVVIRGKGTISNYSPLYIVDGVYTGDISYLNPADIESIDVLKDAASAAIYGSQAANGVVLVTTRQGKNNQPAKVTLDAFYGWQNAPRKAQLLDAKQYATIMNEAAVNSGKDPYFTNEQIANLPVNTNWLDQMFVKNAPTQNYVLGLQGGNNGSVYSLALGYTGQAGIVGGKSLSNYERYTVRLNSEHALYNKVIKIGQHLTYTDQKNNGIGVGGIYGNTLRGAFGVSPFVPMYDADGNFYDNSNSTWNPGESNPYAEMYYNNQNRNSNQRLFGDVYALIEPIKGLRLRSSVGVNYGFSDGRSYRPIYKLSVYSFNNNSTVFQSMGRNRSLQFDNLLSYSFNVKQEHNFEVMAGTTAIKTVASGIWGGNRDLTFAGLNYAWLSNATNREGANISLGGSPYEESLLSYFGRLQYNFKEKYLLNATFRADGSSRFAPGNRWGYFPSVAAGWVLSKEDFMADSRVFSFFKLRGSWGQVGNQNITNNQYLAPITFSNTNYIFGNQEGVLTPGAYPSRLGNPDIKWETSEQLNIGFDATVKGKLNVNFDYYIKKTKDWLIVAPVPATAGADAPYINGGDVKNTGVELALSYRSNIGKVNYTIGVNGAYNKNVIGSIPTPDQTIHGNTNSLFNNSGEFYRAQNGFPVGYFWGLKTDGVFQSEAELAAYAKNGVKIQPNAAPGDVRYVDLNNDGIISDADRTMIGNPNPDFTFGFTLAADYKGFDISVLASGVAGNELVQSWRNHANSKDNYSAAILERWHGPGSSNRIPRVTEDNRNWTQFSDLYIHKGDYLRINNLTIGYDFSQLVKNKFISKVRLYGAALNLVTFTKYNGMDPEIGYGEGFSSGVDLGFYPRARTYMIGANIKF
jgi:TonB-dependent starch-binding outer membrane protein SusC